MRNLIFRALFAGEGCFCLYCGKTYRKFLHQGVRAEVFRKTRVSGAGYMKNVRCPNCGSNQRTRLLRLFFEHRTDIFKRPTRVLHISPKPPLAHFLRNHETIDYVCGALYPERFQTLDAIRVDITAMGFSDEEFDLVICNHVLEHVPDDRAGMREIYRVLKMGGFAVLQVPLALDQPATLCDPEVVSEKDRKRLYGQKDHVRLYGLDYLDKLAEVGFVVERDNPLTNKWISDLGQHCLDRNEDVILARKNAAA
ncbi:MAG: methyltransferase domain-containing protein [Gemmatimonadota bacterium]